MGMGNSPLAGLAALGLGGLNTANTGGLNPAGNLVSIRWFSSGSVELKKMLNIFFTKITFSK